MKRAPIVEDWSRFNRAVLDVADSARQPAPQKQPASPPKRDPPEPGDSTDTYGLITRHKWRKHA